MLMHKEKWAEHSDLSGKDKEIFLQCPDAGALYQRIGCALRCRRWRLLFWLDMTIISDVIGGMLFDPTESNEKQEKALSIFERVNDGPSDKGEHKVTVKVR
jgi:hypothetical protein